MRVSSLSIAQNFVTQLGKQQTALQRTQLQISTGERFSRPAQDPVAATRALELQRAVDETSQYATNAELARNRLSLAEGALTAVGETLQRLRELGIQAANATETNESRALIATEVRQRLDGLLQLANTQDGNGQYLFAGFSTRTRPFSQTPTGFQYNGDQGQRLLQIGPGRYIADGDPGSRVFQMARNGNGTFAVDTSPANAGTAVVGARGLADPSQWDGGSYQLVFTAPDTYEVRDAANAVVTSGAYVPGQNVLFRGVQLEISGTPAVGDSFSVSPSSFQDVFTTARELVDTLALSTESTTGRARFQNAINHALEDIDQALGNVLEVRADIGGRLRSIEDQQKTNVDLDVELRTTLSQVKDLDYAEALTRLNQQLVGLQAAQQGYVKMQGLSLFNYL